MAGDVVRQGLDAGMVEDEGRGQVQAEAGGKQIAQLHGACRMSYMKACTGQDSGRL